MSRHDPLTPEERALARLLGGRLDKAPPPAVDAAVLAAAERAVQHADAQPASEPGPAAAPNPAGRESTPPRRQHRRPAWHAVAGLAASVVFAVGLAWQLRPEPPQMPTPDAASVERAPDGVVEPFRSATSAAESAPAAAPAPAPPAAEVTPQPSPARIIPPSASPSSAAPAQVQVPAPAARAAPHPGAPAADRAVPSTAAGQIADAIAERSVPPPARQDAPPPAAAPKADSAAASATAPAAVSSGPTTKRAPMPPSASTRDGHDARAARLFQAPAAKQARAAPATISAQAVQQEVEADARLTRRQWLQKIRHRRDAGDADIARASLERYLAQYPETRLPRDLQPLLAD